MKSIIALLAALLLMCTSCGRRSETGQDPKYGDKDIEAVLPEAIRDLVNCTTADYIIPWGAAPETATIALVAKQMAKEPVIRLRSAPVTHELIRFDYEVTEVTEGEFSEAIVSFFSFEVYEDGFMYKRLIMPAECKFFLANLGGKCRIVSVGRKNP